MKDQHHAASQILHENLQRSFTNRRIADEMNHAPRQAAARIARYYMGMAAYAQTLHKLVGDDYAPPMHEEAAKCAAQILDEMRKWHVATFGEEVPWIKAVKHAEERP